jgi:ankyrin repeat protein
MHTLVPGVKRALENNNFQEVEEILGQNPGLLEFDTVVFGSWLNYACAKGQIEWVKFFIRKGLSPNRKSGDKNGNSLNSAASKGHSDIVRFLLGLGIEMDVSEPTANPLFGAILAGSVETVRILIDAGIDTTVRYEGPNMKNRNALEFAGLYGNKDIIRMLENAPH